MYARISNTVRTLVFAMFVWYRYFIIDVVANFFLAVEINGVREGRLKVIAKHYLRGWFTIDFVSCIPIQ